MKTTKQLLLLFLLMAGLWHTAGAQCQASFSLSQQPGTNVVSFTNTSTGNYSAMQWYFGDGSVANGPSNVSHTYAPGMYGVCLTVWDSLNGCQSTFCDTLVVLTSSGSSCAANFNVYQPNGSTIQVTNTSTGPYSFVSYNFGDGTVVNSSLASHTYTASGTYTICLTIADSLYNCSDTYCSSVTVQVSGSGNCDASFSMIDSMGYVFFQPSTYNANWSYFWNFGDGTSSWNPFETHTYNGAGPYVPCLTVIDSVSGCTATSCDSLYFSPTNCSATFFYQISGNTIYLYPSTSGGAITTYLWNFGDGASGTGQYPSHTYAVPGTYTVCIAIYTASGCTDSTCQTITIPPASPCQAGFTWNNPLNNQVLFYNTSPGSQLNFFWNFGDGSTSNSTNPSHIYAAAGTYYACLTIIDSSQGCADTYCDTIIVNPSVSCQAQMSISQLSTNGFYFQNTSSGNVASSFWNFGDGVTSTSGSLIHQYQSAGMYYACLTVTFTNGCVSTTCDTVVVAGSSGCNAQFTYIDSSGTVYFNPVLTVGYQYYWNFGDGTTSVVTYPSHTYATPGVYNACLIVAQNGVPCDSVCTSIVIGSTTACNAQFQAYDSLNTWFFFPSLGNYTNYYWSFGDGTMSTATYPSHIYSSGGYYTVCLTVIDSTQGCTATWCDSIFVPFSGNCQAYFSHIVDSINGNMVYFFDQSIGSYSNVVWNFGDGSTSSQLNPVHTYANAGTYYACLTIFGNNCQDSYCDTIVIGSGSNCIPNFYAVPDSVFGNGNVTFTISNNCPGWQYVWSFGDSTTYSGAGPFVHQYPATGWYYVCVTAYDNNGNTITWCDSIYAFRFGATGLSESNQAIPVNVFPNPSSGPVTVTFDLKDSSPLTIEVLSMQGQLIQRIEQEYPSGENQLRLDPAMLESGMYLLKLRSSAEQQTLIRFSIQR